MLPTRHEEGKQLSDVYCSMTIARQVVTQKGVGYHAPQLLVQASRHYLLIGIRNQQLAIVGNGHPGLGMLMFNKDHDRGDDHAGYV